MSASPGTDTHETLQRITALVGRLIQQNRDLTAECDDLYDHIEVLNSKLSAREADFHTLKQEAQALPTRAQAEEDLDQQRLERVRAELESFLSEIDARHAARTTHV